MHSNKYLPKELQKHIKDFIMDDKLKHKIKLNKVMNNIKYLKDSYDEGVMVGQLFLNPYNPDAVDSWFEWGCRPMRYGTWISVIISAPRHLCEYGYLIHNFIKMNDNEDYYNDYDDFMIEDTDSD